MCAGELGDAELECFMSVPPPSKRVGVHCLEQVHAQLSVEGSKATGSLATGLLATGSLATG